MKYLYAIAGAAIVFAVLFTAFDAKAASILSVFQGGTGVGTFTSSQILYGNGTNPLSSVSTTTLTGTGAVSFSNPISVIGSLASVVSCLTASGSQNGCLSSTDWTTFNNKQPAGNYITALTGDATASGPGSVAATLATVNSNVGSFTNANITVNGKGLITAASNGSGGGSGVTSIGPTGQTLTGAVGIATTTSHLNGFTGLTVTGAGSALTFDPNFAVTGDTSWSSHKITSLLDPTNAQDAATKIYVDSAVQGTDAKDAVVYASTGALPAVVYANGSSGVGATLTGVSVGALSLDSSSPTVGQRVLIKNQVSTFQNGIYAVTATGSGIAVFVMTRTTDFDQAADIDIGDTVFVTNGSTLANTTWVQNATNNPTMGTDPITFAQIAGPGLLIGGTGINISGSTISNTGVISNSCPGGFLTCSGTNPSTFTLGTLGIGNGGTGVTSLAAGTINSNGTILYSTGTSTATISTGLTYSGTWGQFIGGVSGNLTVNTSQNISTLSNLTTNGFVTTSGSTGALSVTVPGTGCAAWLATPSSANLATCMTDETGTAGSLVFSASPNFSGQVAIASTAPFATLAVNPVAGVSANQFVVGSSTATAFKIDNGGRLTIGTTTAGTLKTTAAGLVYADTAGSGVSGSGAAGQATFWTSTSAVSGDNAFFWDNTNKRLGLGSTSPWAQMSVSDNKAHTVAVASTSVWTVAGSTNTYMPPAGVAYIVISEWGAGGGGSRNFNGGGAGAFIASTTIASPGPSTIYIGAGGTGGQQPETAGTGGAGYKAGGNGSTSGSGNAGGGGGGSSAFVAGNGTTVIASGGGGAGSLNAGTTPGLGASGSSGGAGGAGNGTNGAGGGGGAGTVGGNAVTNTAGAGGTGGTTQTGTNGNGGPGNASTNGGGGGSSAGAGGNGAVGGTPTGGAGSGGAAGGGSGAAGTNAADTGNSGGGGGGGTGAANGGTGGLPGAGGGGGVGTTAGTGGTGRVVVTAYVYTDTNPVFAVGDATNTAMVVTNTGSFGLGTTSPMAQFAMTATQFVVRVVASTISATPYILEQLDAFGHYYTGGPPPTANSCAGFAVTGNDRAGTITFTSATSCSITFAKAWDSTPVCVFVPGSASSNISIPTISTTGVTFAFASNNTALRYICQGTR